MQPPTQQQRSDKEVTEYLYEKLMVLPGVIGGIESEAAALTNAKREAQANLEDAELNATLNAPQNGKNADARKLELQAALANDPNIQKLRKEVARYDSELEMNEAEAKSRRREFQATLALAELHAARINAMYRIQQIQSQAKKEN